MSSFHAKQELFKKWDKSITYKLDVSFGCKIWTILKHHSLIQLQKAAMIRDSVRIAQNLAKLQNFLIFIIQIG